jgi:transposase
VLGVDDWALRKGQRYGTILCDLERRLPVDLLPERSAAALKCWLRNHPEVEIISRDRGDDYIKGASEGAPQAVQVADRWHLLRNLRETLARVVDRYQGKIRDAARVASQHLAFQKLETLTSEASSTEPLQNSPLEPDVWTKNQERQRQRRARRLTRFDQVRELHHQGVSLRSIARRLGLHRGTVRRFVRAEVFPERASRPTYRRTDPWIDYLRRRWDEGCHSAVQLTQELKTQGFQGSYEMVRRRVASWRLVDPAVPAPGHTVTTTCRIPARPSSTRVSWLLLKKEPELQMDERIFVDEVGRQCPALQAAAALARAFMAMVQDRRPEDWQDWLIRAQDPNMALELGNFAAGLRADERAVRAALTLEWSNGQVEGQINRLKTIKRQMYGRANFDLLRQRVLHAA